MGLFFNYDNPVCDEGSTPVVFSYDPTISSLRELILFELSFISYYSYQLEQLDVDVKELNNKIIAYITEAVVNLDFRKEQFLSMIKNLYDTGKKLEDDYVKVCEKRNIPANKITGEKLTLDTGKEIIDAVNLGERKGILKNTVYSKRKHQIIEIATMLISNACIYISEIESYSVNCPCSKKSKIIELIKTLHYDNLSYEEYKRKIFEFSKINKELMDKLNNIILNKYGPVEETEVDLSIKEGKCILVSGHSYNNLELLLNTIENEEINVYTHGEMLSAHSYKKFRDNKNLVGHFQKSLNNSQLDFSNFPGAILITKNSQQDLNIIRGSIWTFDKNPAKGINKIINNDFKPIIKHALKQKGFKKDININKIKIGYNEEFFINKIKEISSKINSGEIKHLFVIGLINYNTNQNLYFNEFFKLLPKDCYAVSFSYERNEENVWSINSHSDMAPVYTFFKELVKDCNYISEKVSVFLTQCQLGTISHAFNLKLMNIKNIYLGKCCPNVMSPILIEGLKEEFEIYQITDSAEKDINTILNS